MLKDNTLKYVQRLNPPVIFLPCAKQIAFQSGAKMTPISCRGHLRQDLCKSRCTLTLTHFSKTQLQHLGNSNLNPIRIEEGFKFCHTLEKNSFLFSALSKLWNQVPFFNHFVIQNYTIFINRKCCFQVFGKIKTPSQC